MRNSIVIVAQSNIQIHKRKNVSWKEREMKKERIQIDTEKKED